MSKTVRNAAPVDVFPHPSKEEARIFFYDARVVPVDEGGSGSNEEKPIVDYVGSDDSEDRYGSIIDPRGWETDAYMRSGAGVVLWAHQYDTPPVGRTVRLTKNAKALVFRVEFAVAQSEFAREVWQLVRDGFLPGVSVGFIPKAAEEYEAETVNSYFAENKRYTKQELLELSIVPVPANRNALKKAYAEGKISDRTIALAHMENFIKGDGPIYLARATMRQEETPKDAPKVEEPKADDKPKVEEPKKDEKPSQQEVVKQMRDWVFVDTQEELEITDEERDGEITVMNGLAASYVDQIQLGINGWMSSKHGALRGICRGAVMNGMFNFDDIRTYMKTWYGQTPDSTIENGLESTLTATFDKTRERATVTVKAEGFEKMVKAAVADAITKTFIDPGDPMRAVRTLIRDIQALLEADDSTTRKGAKLSKKNKETLLKALELLQSLDGLAEAADDEEEEKKDDKATTKTDDKNGETTDTNDTKQTDTGSGDGSSAIAAELVGGTSGTKNVEVEKTRTSGVNEDFLANFRRELNIGTANGDGVKASAPSKDTVTDEQKHRSETASSPKKSYLDQLIGRTPTK